jgi:hypothetical protein
MKKLILQKFLVQQTELTPCFPPRHALERKTYCTLRECATQPVPHWLPPPRVGVAAWERNSELFSLLRNGSERNSEGLLLILFHGTEFRAFFSSAGWFGTEFREFSVPRNSRNSAGTNQLFRIFHLPRNNFFVGNCQP